VIALPLEGKTARTEYSVCGRYRDFTVVQVRPVTGRTNQIRLHFKAIGHPLVGEKKFVFRKDFALRANRLCLHARSLEFKHPITGKAVSVESVLPAGMANFLKKHAE
jgi:23S rRNA pseudouridine1911/1915/1917 synthase